MNNSFLLLEDEELEILFRAVNSILKKDLQKPTPTTPFSLQTLNCKHFSVVLTTPMSALCLHQV